MKYREAGVDIAAGEAFVRLIKPFVRTTFGPDVLTELGSFGGVIRVHPAGPDTLLVASIDGVGTKMLLAAEHDRLDDIGRDLVHHCVNDIAVHGAKPLLFLDYIGAGRLEPERAARMVAGMAAACVTHGAALLGGETAEMPGLYQEGHYDLVGAIVGIVARERFIDGKQVQAGDRLIGLASDGLHTNGYSLARRALFDSGRVGPLDTPPELQGPSLLDELLRPHRCYLPSIQALIESGLLKGAAHITGGGIEGNLARILPGEVDALVHRRGWSIPPLFRIIAAAGPISDSEMFRAFNMGVGLILVVKAADEEAALVLLSDLGETAFPLGSIVSGAGRVRFD